MKFFSLIFFPIELIFRIRNYLIHHLFIKGIKRSDFVLEVGSGDNPKPRSDVLVEKFIDDDLERVSSVVIDRPIICADINNLPFKDKSFDFIICTHLLEHIIDLEKALKELIRVGKAGYIETPASFSERLSGYPFHLWYVDIVDSKIRFLKKTKPIHDEDIYKKVAEYFNTNIFFRLFCFSTSPYENVRFYWKDKIDYEIIDNTDGINKDILHDFNRSNRSEKPIKKLIFRSLKRLIRASFYWPRSNLKKGVLRRVKCPICKKNIDKNKESYSCINNHKLNLIFPD